MMSFQAVALVLSLAVPSFAQEGGPPPEAPSAPTDATWKPVVGQPAPELGCTVWIDDGPPSKGTITTSVSSEHGVPVSRTAKRLSDLQDHVVIVHTFAWNDAAATDKALPLVRDLVAANSDRRLAAIGIADAIEADAARRQTRRSRRLEYPIALEDLSKSTSPYVDLPHTPLAMRSSSEEEADSCGREIQRRTSGVSSPPSKMRSICIPSVGSSIV